MKSSISLMPISHRSVLTIAVPIMLSNVTEPLIGVVNTAVIGQLPEAYYIGAISIGSLIFSFLFWGFGFLRLSTGGLSAQAVGAGDPAEVTAVLWRALAIAVAVGLCLILASPAIEKVSFDLMGGSPEMRAQGEIYFRYRILSAPFALTNFCILGWFIGQGRAAIAFVVQIFLNVVNMGLGAWFVLSLGMTADGVGLSALVAEVAAVLLGGCSHLALRSQDESQGDLGANLEPRKNPAYLERQWRHHDPHPVPGFRLHLVYGARCPRRRRDHCRQFRAPPFL